MTAELKVQLEEFQAESEQRIHRERTRHLESTQLLKRSEQACAKLEARIVRNVRWREEAERQIHEMVSCGESLECECTQLRQELCERGRHLAHDEHTETLRSSLEQEERQGEILKAGLSALEQDNAELMCSAEHERRCRLDGAARHSEALNAVQQERGEFIREYSIEAAKKRAAEAARSHIVAAWERERACWDREHAELEHRAAHAQAELESANRALHAESRFAAEEHSRLQELGEVTRTQLQGESETYARAATQLELRISQAQTLQADMEERLAMVATEAAAQAQQRQPCGVGPPSAANGPPSAASSPSTPQLQGLDEYAVLVGRLRTEVSLERREREASAGDLAALDASYRLLLQCADVGCGGRGSAGAAEEAAADLVWAVSWAAGQEEPTGIGPSAGLDG